VYVHCETRRSLRRSHCGNAGHYFRPSGRPATTSTVALPPVGGADGQYDGRLTGRLARGLSAATAAAAVLDLGLAVTGRARRRRFTKTLLMPLVAARLLAAAGPHERELRNHTLLALTLSSAGDATILGESDRALAGGAAWFALAQLAYVRGFRRAGSRPTVAGTAPIVLAAVAGIAGYWPHAGRLRPVLVTYPPLLAAMAVCATGLPGPAGARVTLGARVFLLSDTLVGAQRFLGLSRRRRAALEVPAMLTYVAAQYLIADGVARATVSPPNPASG